MLGIGISTAGDAMMEISPVNRLGWGKMGERNRGDAAFDAGEKERENIGIGAPLKWCIAGIVASSYTPLHSCVYKAFAEDDKNRREVVRHVVVPYYPSLLSEG